MSAKKKMAIQSRDRQGLNAGRYWVLRQSKWTQPGPDLSSVYPGPTLDYPLFQILDRTKDSGIKGGWITVIDKPKSGLVQVVVLIFHGFTQERGWGRVFGCSISSSVSESYAVRGEKGQQKESSWLGQAFPLQSWLETSLKGLLI